MVTLDLTDEYAIIIGDDYSLNFAFQDEACEPIDQTGATFFAQLRRIDDTLVAEFDTNVASEVVTVSLSSADTEDFTAAKNLRWDLERHEGGLIHTIIGGKAEIVKGVTQV